MRYHEWLHAVVYCPWTEAVDPWLAKEAQAGAGEADGGVNARSVRERGGGGGIC